MRAIYTILIVLATPLILLYFAVRGLSDQSYLMRWAERFAHALPDVKPNGILLHAASVGEVNASRELVRALADSYPERPITVSTLTPTGSAQVGRVLGDSVFTCFIPIDIPWIVTRFIKRLQPALIIVIETEIWPNLYFQAQKQEIPLLMANARLSERSARHYSIVSEFIAQTLARVTWIGAQSADDQRRLVECGANPDIVRMTGNLKFDLEIAPSLRETGMALRARWGQSRPVLVAGSTHEADEDVLFPAFNKLLVEYPDALLIIVPRHPERFNRAAQLARNAGLQTELYSVCGKACSTQTQCFVVDTIGALMTYYACGDIAYVGGGIGDQGGHNALEPAALGLPVLFGPNMDNARDIADQLLVSNAAVCVSDAQDFVTEGARILGDANLRDHMGRAGQALVDKNRGALDTTLRAVKGLLK
jgi:3-deoxy-D-manno-octulosonic-acid transferase